MTAWDSIQHAARPELRAFETALLDPEAAQRALLSNIVRDNQATAFGRRHRFSQIRSLQDFQHCVPIMRHEDRAEDLARIAEGEPNVLTAAPVIAFEETGGSTAGAKLVPYTGPALAAIRRAALAWLGDLLHARPGLTRGRLYVALSPATRLPRQTAGGVPIGLPGDAAYLGEDLAGAFAALSAVPFEVGLLGDMQSWQRATLTHLLAAHDLTLLSVWSPTFLTALLDAAPALWPAIASDVARLAGNERAAHIGNCLQHAPPLWNSIWPLLDTVSAWTSAASASPARRLAGMLPHALLQGKGLLATEGAITIPFSACAHPLPALTSSVLEFIPEGSGTCAGPLGLTALEPGAAYRVLMTTPGGFYRYDIGDRMACRGYLGPVPMLEFLGRAGLVSDLAGEKLTEDFVAARLPASARFALLAPMGGPPLRYVLLIDAADRAAGPGWAGALDIALCDNPQYRYARALQQLAPVKAVPVQDAEAHVGALAIEQGRRWGDLKPASLTADTSLVERLGRAHFCTADGDAAD